MYMYMYTCIWIYKIVYICMYLYVFMYIYMYTCISFKHKHFWLLYKHFIKKLFYILLEYILYCNKMYLHIIMHIYV